MTDQPETAGPPAPIMLGPLTAEEWGSLFALTDDRNPLPICCANLSEVRDALADVLRMGGAPETGWLRIAPVWDYVDECLGRSYVLGNPVLSKIYDAYVADREIPEKDGEAYERFRAMTLEQVKMYLDTVDAPDTLFDLTTRPGRIHALNRMAGAFIAFIVDDDERQEAAFRLAEKVGLDPGLACFAVDLSRQDHGLPHRPTHQAERDSTDETSVR